jgi:O-phospho-L-seryl-tRNASec:L-selenocysteinyl-tRNA synthase
MDADNLQLASGLVSASYVAQGGAALAARRRLIKGLLSNRRLPQNGWDEATIEMLLQVRASFDIVQGGDWLSVQCLVCLEGVCKQSRPY